MRLTIVNQYYTPDLSPTAHLVASLAEHRAALGDDVTVIASWGGYVATEQVADREGESRVRVRRVWTPRAGKASHWRRLFDYLCFYVLTMIKVVFLRRQDVIVCLTTPPMIAWAGALHKLFRRRVRLVLWNMDCYPEAAERYGVIREGGWASRCLRFLNRRLFARLDHLVVLDPAMKELLLGHYQPRRHQLPTTIIPNWERADFFPPDQTAPPWSGAQQLGLTDKFVVLYLGNMGFGHTFQTILAAAERLRDEPIVFLFVGGGKRFDDVRQQAEERQLTNIVLHGYVPKEMTPTVMSAADCCLITLDEISLGVMSPSKLHSNLAEGLPVLYVGPPGSNVDEAIQRFQCGVSLREGDVEGVVSFVKQLQQEPKTLQALSGQARRAFDLAYNDVVCLRAFDRVLDEND